jgi:uncharacterized membrane protein YjdF
LGDRGAVAQLTHPELGAAFVGSQGDLWDAQHDMLAADVRHRHCAAADCHLAAMGGRGADRDSGGGARLTSHHQRAAM